MAAESTVCAFGWKARDFRLAGTDGRSYSLADVKGPKGTVVVFLSNHCPYVRSTIDRIARDLGELKAQGIGSVAIMPNDTAAYPADSFANMKLFAAQHRFPFPYLIDETQKTARAYDAQCTPDFFGFNAASSCNIAAGSTAPGGTPPRPACGASSSRRCSESPPPARARRGRCRASDARSSGRANSAAASRPMPSPARARRGALRGGRRL
jgi:peroxiredoxin